MILRYWIKKDIYKHAGGEILDILSDAPRFNRWMADTVQPFLGADVLELGAGIGNLSRRLCRMRQRYVASDIDEQHLTLCGPVFRSVPAWKSTAATSKWKRISSPSPGGWIRWSA